MEDLLADSKFTTGVALRYVPVEGESLAMTWSSKSRHFNQGNEKLMVLVDQKPLLKILGDRELVDTRVLESL